MTANVEKELKALRTQLAALSASLDARARAPESGNPKAKKDLWETVAERRIGVKGAKVGRIVAHVRCGGKDFVTVGKTFGGKTVKRIAVDAAALKAAVESFDL